MTTLLPDDRGRFAWLMEELASIHTPKYHCVEGSDDPVLHEAVAASGLRLPKGYKHFVIQFGNGRFFRQSFGGYKLGIYAGPRKHAQNHHAYQIGYVDGQPVNLREGEAGVFGADLQRPRNESFERWLFQTYHRLKAAYSASAWATIQAGPSPFDENERRLMEARQLYRWQDLGLDERNDRLLRIENGSDGRIPCLTLGVRSPDGRLNGGIILEVGQIAPGEAGVVTSECYKKLADPSRLILFDLANLGPEDRPYLVELKRLKFHRLG